MEMLAILQDFHLREKKAAIYNNLKKYMYIKVRIEYIALIEQ